jgi:4-hydroxy-2-oxoheptanedioate aldolase|tara:strand:- start:105 stop:875 length:771 start_codon:yes stop_codon:yes gene_type:complete
MLKKNFIKEKLSKNIPVIGTWVVVPSIINIDIICSSGIDFIIIDREHGPITFETAQRMAIACESRNVSPLMRVGDIEKSFIQNALDIGVHGIQIPNINSKKDALEVINYSKYPPIGDRGFSPFTRAGDYSNKNSKKLLNDANKNTIVVLNIEGKNALDNIDEIISVNNIDIIFVGLFDLSKELQIPGDIENPKIIDALKFITNKCKEKGIYVGTIATNLKQIDRFLEIGLKYIVYGVDCNIIKNSYEEIVNHFNKL